jgi:hypothetical protein
MRDWDAKPAGHALRFVFANLYDTLNTLIFVPLRTGVEVTKDGLGRIWR